MFNPQPYKMVKHIQTNRRLLPTNCLSVFNHFVGLMVIGLKDKRTDGIPGGFFVLIL